MSKSPLVVAITLLITVSLLATAGSLGFLLTPYDPTAPTYSIAHESTDGFEDVLDGSAVERDDAVAVESVSADVQRVFEEAIEQPPETRRGTAGWQTADVTVCQEGMVVCDAFEEPPTTDGSRYTVLEDDGELYVLDIQRPHGADGGLLIASLGTGGAVLVFSGLLALVGFTYREAPTAGVFGSLTIGLAVCLWPYLVMIAGVATYWWLVLPVICVGILVLGWQLLVAFWQSSPDTAGTPET